MRNIFGLAFLTFFLCLSCTNDQVKRAANYLPNSSGRVDEVLLVMDENQWKGNEGEVVRNVFMQDYKVLPQPEPIFSLSQVPAQALSDLLQRSASVMVIADLSKDDPTAKLVKKQLTRFESQGKPKPPYFMRKDVWATPQQVLYIYDENAIQLTNKLMEFQQTFIDLLYKMEDSKARNNAYISGISKGLTKTLKDEFALDFEVPNLYREVLKADSLLWIRHDNQSKEEVSNIMVFVEPYTQEAPITQAYPIVKIQAMGKLVGTDIEGSFLYPSDKYIPFEQVMAETEAGTTVKSMGLWSMQNDFMGGAFTSYSFNDTANKRRVTLFGFVYAPRGKKRLLMRRLDMLFKGVKPT